MKRHRQSQEALGALLDPPVGQAAVGHWLRGTNQITVERFLQLCAAAGADPQKILFDQSSAQAALEILRDHVVTNHPDKHFAPPGKPAETMPLGANTARKGEAKPSKRPQTPEIASERPKGR